MNVGIVGNEAEKFTPVTEARAREIIRRLLAPADVVLVSGHCHLGGIDIWAEEEYDALPDRRRRPPPLIFPPKELKWSMGYQPRNILIAEHSAVVHNIVVSKYPSSYAGMHFEFCYHCRTKAHVKSGGCWTAKYEKSLGKLAYWHIIRGNV